MAIKIQKIDTETGKNLIGKIKASEVEFGLVDAHYIFVQIDAATEWNIAHNLGKVPSVKVVDSAGSVVRGIEEVVDTNNIKLIFSFAFAGTAYLN